MRIRYTGRATVRQALGYEWTRRNGYVSEVGDPGHVLELLTHPPGDFAVSDDEPLVTTLGLETAQAAELALASVTGLSDLAALDAAGVRRLALALPWANEKRVERWAEQARESLAAGQVEKTEEV